MNYDSLASAFIALWIIGSALTLSLFVGRNHTA